jgi:hypothetical protein
VQLIEQRLRLLQIERVKAFGKPPINRSKQFASLLRLPLIAPDRVEPQSVPECDFSAQGRRSIPLLGSLLLEFRIGVHAMHMTDEHLWPLAGLAVGLITTVARIGLLVYWLINTNPLSA